jgi:predicted Zn-dependent peptidase
VEKGERKEYEMLTMENGLRVIHRQVSGSSITHCGFIIDVGSRHEDEGVEGIAHFTEHMLFKGTKKRKSFHILNRMEIVGGELNAYTTRDKTCYYASFLDRYLERAMELLTDIVFNSTFPAPELEKEKKVVMEEIGMYLDSPEESIYDDFQELVFRKHPLGKNILGNQKSIAKFNSKTLRSFTAKHYVPSRMVFVVVSSLPATEIKKLAHKYFSAIPSGKAPEKSKKFKGYKPFHKTVEKQINQAHCILGTTAYDLYDKKRLGLLLLSNILGGPGMNSKLALSIREKYGYAYSIDASYAPYEDTGLFNVYFGTETRNVEKCRALVMKELEKLKAKKIGSLQFGQYKRQFNGQIAMAEESRVSVMLSFGKSLLDYGRIDSLKEIFSRVERLTPTELFEIANEIFDEEKMSSMVYTAMK